MADDPIMEINKNIIEIRVKKKLLFPSLSWLMFSLGVLFYCYQILMETLPNIFVTFLISDFNVNDKQIGFLTSSYLFAFAVFQPWCGLLLDRFGMRYLLASASFIYSVSILLFAHSHILEQAILSRIMSGIADSFALIGILFIIAKWFPTHRFPLLAGITIMLGHLTGLLQRPFAHLMATYDWRQCLYSLSWFGIAIAFTQILFFQNPGIQQKESKFSIKFTSIKSIISNKNNWLLAFYGGAMFIPTEIFTSLWGMTFLRAYYPNTEQNILLNINVLIFLGWTLGSPFAGWLSDYFKKRKFLLTISSIGTLSTLLIITYIPAISISIMHCLFFLLGFFSAASTLYFSLIIAINPQNLTATSLGFANSTALMVIVIILPIFGFFLDKYSSSKLINLNHIPVAAFQHALILPIVIMLIASILTTLLIIDKRN